MSQNQPLPTSRYMLLIFAAIVAVFVFLMMIKLWHGNNYPDDPQKNKTKEVRSDV